MTHLPPKHPRWSKTERHLYGGQAYRALGEQDHRGNVLVEILSGGLAGEYRWFSPEELQVDPPADATEAKNPRKIR